MPRISVVMPSYNQGHFIREAIDSILSQEGVDVELIVMDGGSDDGTVETLRSYGDQLTFTSGPDEGQSWAINEGMRRTTEDIVCWLNSDDLFRPGALQTVLEVFESDSEVEFVTGAGRNIAGDGTLIGDVGAQPARLWELIHHRNFFNQPSCFMKRDLWFDAGGLNEDLDYVMDWDLWIRFGCAKSVFVDVQLSDNRSYDDNKTNSGGQARLTEIEQMVATYTRAPAPPVLELYGLETAIKAEETSDEARPELGRRFMAGMSERISGVDARGAFGAEFSFSLTPRASDDRLVAEFSSVARYVGDQPAPIVLQWRSEGNGSGAFSLEPKPEQQEYEFPFTLKMGEVATIDVVATGQGFSPVGRREILGYFDRAGSKR